MLTEKKKAFAREYKATGNASEAYRRCYNAKNMTDRAITVEASRLVRDPDVSLMLTQLEQKIEKRFDVTVDSLSETLREAIALAKEVKAPAAVVSAVMAMGKLHGLIVEKRQVEHMNGKEDLSDNELADIALGRRGALAETSEGSTLVN